MWQQLAKGITNGDYRALARAISLVENEYAGSLAFLQELPVGRAPVTGITGPPGAGKSTLADALIGAWLEQGKKVGVLCVDPSSPFHLGALLGDRIRMSRWYSHPGVFIRSLASRGALGGLHPHIIEIMTVMQAAGFDELLIETVGVGQSEIEIAGLADTTVVVVVPEAGDEVQTMKAGIMEIADIFVVNKADRPEADAFVYNLQAMLAPAFGRREQTIPILKTVATTGEGIPALADAIRQQHEIQEQSLKKYRLLAEKAYRLIQQQRMQSVDKNDLIHAVQQAADKPGFNLFAFIQPYFAE